MRFGPRTRPALGLFMLLAGACAVNPVSGRHEVVLMSENDEREEGT